MFPTVKPAKPKEGEDFGSINGKSFVQFGGIAAFSDDDDARSETVGVTLTFLISDRSSPFCRQEEVKGVSPLLPTVRPAKPDEVEDFGSINGKSLVQPR